MREGYSVLGAKVGGKRQGQEKGTLFILIPVTWHNVGHTTDPLEVLLCGGSSDGATVLHRCCMFSDDGG